MITDEKIIEAVSNSLSMREAAEKVGIPFSSFKRRAEQLNIYKPNPFPRGKYNISEARKKYLKRVTTPLQDILEGKYPNFKTQNLKEKLFDVGLKNRKCEKCGIGEIWNNEPLVLELDHINGKKEDHRLENLKILCPNCHSQTPTFRGRKNAIVWKLVDQTVLEAVA